MAFPNVVSAVANWSPEAAEYNVGPCGPFNDAGNRYMILLDQAALKLRAYKSTDSGTTWTEQDALNAPDVADESGSPAPGLYNYFGVVQDTRGGTQKLYAVYWFTDFTISLISFDTGSDTWGARVASTLGYAFPGFPTNTSGFSVAFRATNPAVWMMFPGGQDAVTPVGMRVLGAKCDLTGPTWDLALTPLGQTDPTDLHDWQPFGMVTDSGGNVHCFFASYTVPGMVLLPPYTSAISHQVIHTDDTLSAVDQIAGATSALVRKRFERMSIPSISAADEIIFTYLFSPAAEWHVVRATAADAPTWNDEVPAGDFQSGTGPFRGTVSHLGVDYIFYARDAGDGINSIFAYIFSTGIGLGWSVEQLISLFDFTGVPVISLAVQPQAFNPLVLTTAYNALGAATGQGYFELEAAAVARPLTAQVAFQGVRRVIGTRPRPNPHSKPKSFTYVVPATISGLVSVAPRLTVRQTISDYDFELYQVIITVQEPGSLDAPLLVPVATIWLYDYTKTAISNIPMLDLFMDGGPQGVYKNGAIVTPLFYPKESQIRMDLDSMIIDPAKVPTTLQVHFVGRQFIPCQ